LCRILIFSIFQASILRYGCRLADLYAVQLETVWLNTPANCQKEEGERKRMQTQTERQTIPTAQAIFLQGQGGRSPDVKRCGYCDRLVRWTLVEGRNVAVNCNGLRHQCLTDGTAKRKQPVKHARPTPVEVDEFLTPVQPQTSQQQAQPELTRDTEIKAMHKDNVAAWKVQTEAISKLAEAMLKVAESNNALAQSNKRLAKTYSRLTRAIERAGYSFR
jgi:hypothetical protein